MFRLLWAFSARVRAFLRRYMPTNILLDALRQRRGIKWGVPAMLFAAPYLVAAWLCSTWVADGGPGWINLLVLLFICYAVVVVMPMMLRGSRSTAVDGLRLSA